MKKRECDYYRRFDSLMLRAQKDAEFCRIMSQLHSASKKARIFMCFLPKSIRNTIYEYANLRAGAMRRLAMIACMCMEFSGEEPFSFEEIHHAKHSVITFPPESASNKTEK